MPFVPLAMAIAESWPDALVKSVALLCVSVVPAIGMIILFRSAERKK